MSRVAVVTGGASGMGEATCHELGQARAQGCRAGHRRPSRATGLRGLARRRRDGACRFGRRQRPRRRRRGVREGPYRARPGAHPGHQRRSGGFRAVRRNHHRRVGAADRGEPDRNISLLSGRGARHAGGGLGSHRDDLVVERPTGLAEDGALRRQQGRAAVADQIACPRIRSAWHHGQQRSAVGHRDADATQGAGGRPSAVE